MDKRFILKNLLFLGGLIAVLASCASNRPALTGSLYYDIGEGKFYKFQVFLSESIQLSKSSNRSVANKDATIVNRAVKNESILFKKSTSGRIQKGITAVNGRDVDRLEVSFEKIKGIDPYPVLGFVRDKVTNRFYLEQGQDGWLDYNGSSYRVEYDGADRPYLLYKDKVKEKTNKRTAKGLK